MCVFMVVKKGDLQRFMFWEFILGMLLVVYVIIFAVGIAYEIMWIFNASTPFAVGIVICLVVRYIYAFRLWRGGTSDAE